MIPTTLLTKHHKARCISPILAKANFIVEEFTDYDTDQLGTFCGEIERKQDAKKTAEHKAKLACKLSGNRYGLGSEGSFFEHPVAGITWEQEIICLYDADEDTCMFGMSEGPATVVSAMIENLHEISEVVAGTSPQKWMWKDPSGSWHKGLEAVELTALFIMHNAEFPQFIAPDYRAMNSPGRQKLIATAAADLVKRLQSKCPICKTAGFVYDSKQTGLPCSTCSLPTPMTKGWWAKCDHCGFKDFSKSPDAYAESLHCPFCNP